MRLHLHAYLLIDLAARVFLRLRHQEIFLSNQSQTANENAPAVPVDNAAVAPVQRVFQMRSPFEKRSLGFKAATNQPKSLSNQAAPVASPTASSIRPVKMRPLPKFPSIADYPNSQLDNEYD